MGRSGKIGERLLRLLAEEPARWRHGYDLLKATGLASGTLYPLLRRLEESGAIEAEWRDSPVRGRPPRHAYRITAAGLRAATAPAAAAGPAQHVLRPNEA